jgi:hypothetical protein
MALSQRPRSWQVRVRRVMEVWINVSAHDKAEAERLAADYPQVMGIFPGSAVRADLKEAEPIDVGVEG